MGNLRNWLQSMPTAEAYWLDKALYDLHHRPEELEQYGKAPHAYLARYPLTPEMKASIVNNDIAALYLSGVNPYLLRAHCIGMRIPEAVSLAALRGVREEV